MMFDIKKYITKQNKPLLMVLQQKIKTLGQSTNGKRNHLSPLRIKDKAANYSTVFSLIFQANRGSTP